MTGQSDDFFRHFIPFRVINTKERSVAIAVMHYSISSYGFIGNGFKLCFKLMLSHKCKCVGKEIKLAGEVEGYEDELNLKRAAKQGCDAIPTGRRHKGNSWTLCAFCFCIESIVL
jgi:hypothetical protein